MIMAVNPTPELERFESLLVEHKNALGEKGRALARLIGRHNASVAKGGRHLELGEEEGLSRLLHTNISTIGQALSDLDRENKAGIAGCTRSFAATVEKIAESAVTIPGIGGLMDDMRKTFLGQFKEAVGMLREHRICPPVVNKFMGHIALAEMIAGGFFGVSLETQIDRLLGGEGKEKLAIFLKEKSQAAGKVFAPFATNVAETLNPMLEQAKNAVTELGSNLFTSGAASSPAAPARSKTPKL